MTLLISKFREISVFIYVLLFLLIFNLIFNRIYNWSGVSLIVRIYLLVLSFYLIFIFASIDINNFRTEYFNKFGKVGIFILFLETRIVPFAFIYLITVLFTLIDQIRVVNWPWQPILSLLNGRYSNNILYAWLLLIILKLKKKPGITILLFISIFTIYGILDKFIGSLMDGGLEISALKLLKIVIFLFFLFSEFFYDLSKRIVVSSLLSVVIFFSIMSTFALVHKYSDINSFQRKEAGLLLIRMGFTYPLDNLKDEIVKSSDHILLNNVLSLSEGNGIEINYSNEEWEKLLFSGSVDMADIISGYIMNKDIKISYEKIVYYAEQKSKNELSELPNKEKFIKLSSKYILKNEKDFLERIIKTNKTFKLWGMRILTENKSIESITLLLNMLTDIDEAISDMAYNSLKNITGIDPAASLDKKKNDPDTIAIFKKYYLERAHNRKI